MKKLFFIFCFFLSPILMFAQEESAPADEIVNVEGTDAQMFNMSIDLKINDGVTAKTVASKPVQQLTELGKPVTLKISSGENLKAAVQFTLYESKNAKDTLVLYAQSRIVMIKEGKKQMLSAVKSMHIKTGEKVLFFPLGFMQNTEKSGYNCMLELDVTKYQQKTVSQD